MELVNCPVILILTGASGAGKTTLMHKLNELEIPGVEGFNCDRVLEEVRGSSDKTDLQAKVLRYWTSKLGRERTQLSLAVLDTQIAPHRALEVLNESKISRSQIVLVDCEPVERNRRLCNERRQPELANAQMDCWAAYLRGQADALNLPIIDTSQNSMGQSLEKLQRLVEELTGRTANSPSFD